MPDTAAARPPVPSALLGRFHLARIEPGDRVLMVADQGGRLTLWAEQEDEREAPLREFTVVGTGWEAPVGLEHVGSAVCGQFVWHVYAEPVA